MPSPQPHPFLNLKKPLVMAHRGGQGLWPPNTLFAFERAVELGVDILEMDIHQTADGVIVVRHDPTVDATTNGKGMIRDYTLAELKNLDAGYTWSADGGMTYLFRGMGITIPTLAELLEALPGVRFNIDIKPREAQIIEPFVQLLHDYDKWMEVLVGSFHDQQLQRFRKRCPQVATAAGVSETRWFYGLSNLRLSRFYRPKAHAFQIPEYVGDLHLVTRRFVRSAHEHGIQVHVWTVNDIDDMRRLLDWGVDGLITDYPDRLQALLSGEITNP